MSEGLRNIVSGIILSIEQLEALGDVLLDFSTAADLVAWLDEAVQ